MESDSIKSDKSSTGDQQEKNSDPLPCTGTILQSYGLRCALQANNGIDRELLGYGYHILWYYTAISWVLFLLLRP